LSSHSTNEKIGKPIKVVEEARSITTENRRSPSSGTSGSYTICINVLDSISISNMTRTGLHMFSELDTRSPSRLQSTKRPNHRNPSSLPLCSPHVVVSRITGTAAAMKRSLVITKPSRVFIPYCEKSLASPSSPTSLTSRSTRSLKIGWRRWHRLCERRS
jgi:hypothetical protein